MRLLLVALATVTVSRPSHAQTAGDGFLFHTPVGSWGFYGGFDRAFAGGDLFEFVTSELTLKRSDFSSVTFGGNVAIRILAHDDLVFDVSYASSSQGSEFRDWVDQNNQPIEQTTSLRRIPITVGLKHYLVPRGRSIGQFAWIPERHLPFVKLSAGLMHYRFRQIGDFVDVQTQRVFSDAFESKAWTPVLRAGGGLDVTVGGVVFTGEARYTWAKGPVGRDYVGFHRIDLSGLSATAGFAVRF